MMHAVLIGNDGDIRRARVKAFPPKVRVAVPVATPAPYKTSKLLSLLPPLSRVREFELEFVNRKQEAGYYLEVDDAHV